MESSVSIGSDPRKPTSESNIAGRGPYLQESEKSSAALGKINANLEGTLVTQYLTKRWTFLACLCFFPLLYGCSGSEMYAGRQALLMNKPEIAVAHFQNAAERDPNATLDFGAFDQSVWTYLGRAQYLTANYAEARQSLQKALAHHPDDDIARMYLGLTLARDNDRPKALPEIASGMKGIHDRIDYIVVNRIGIGEFWDPNMAMRSAIEHNLAMIDSNTIDWPSLISSGEWLGVQVEEEVERVRNDWIADFTAGGQGG